MAKDPVCRMNVDEKTAKFKSEYMGKTYYFCNQSCKTSFDKNPEKYMDSSGGHSMHDGGCSGCCC